MIRQRTRYEAAVYAAGACLLDVAAKAWMTSLLDAPSHSIPILPVLSLTLSFNPGISFGLLPAGTGAGVFALAIASAAAIGLLIWLCLRSRDRLERVGYALIVGGALGNLFDRVHDGYVTDFLDVHFAGWRFPTFNTADIAITCGAALIIVAAFRSNSIDKPQIGSGQTTNQAVDQT